MSQNSKASGRVSVQHSTSKMSTEDVENIETVYFPEPLYEAKTHRRKKQYFWSHLVNSLYATVAVLYDEAKTRIKDRVKTPVILFGG